jgi:hypothetical protein
LDWLEAFLDLAMQYYVAGRFAARAGLVPVHGNLLHHAVEMFLKAVLVGTLTPEELARKPYGHNLLALWDRYKVKEADSTLTRFDTTISALHGFESVRYPDEIVRLGFEVSVEWAPDEITFAAGHGYRPPSYSVVINEVDTLTIEIVRRADLDPQDLLFKVVTREAREALNYSNPQAAAWQQDWEPT